MVYGNFPAAFSLEDLLFPFAVKLNRDALSAGFLAPLLPELIEITNPPNSRPWVLFKDSPLLHSTSSANHRAAPDFTARIEVRLGALLPIFHSQVICVG